MNLAISNLRTRALYSAMNNRRFWCDSVNIPVNAWEELLFWYHNIEYLTTLNISMANLSGSAQVPPGWHTQMAVIVVM